MELLGRLAAGFTLLTIDAAAPDVLAMEVEVKRLALTHISPRYSREAPELLAEARGIFPETVIARDGMELEVAFEVEGAGGGR